MSALTEKVAREHQVVHLGTYVVCACEEAYATPKDYTEHLITVTEAAVRAQVAADIRAEARRVEEAFATSGLAGEMNRHERGLYDAARIAEEAGT